MYRDLRFARDPAGGRKAGLFEMCAATGFISAWSDAQEIRTHAAPKTRIAPISCEITSANQLKELVP